MSQPTRKEQIITAHAPLIVDVVRACHDRSMITALQPVLQTLQQYGQAKLVAAIHEILAGNRDVSVLRNLDEDDATVAEAILRGLQDPLTLPDRDAKPDPTAAAPGLASIIHQAATGDPQALHALANMAEHMTAVGGDMARLGGIMRRLVEGERDVDRLTKGMGAQGESLVVSILQELAKLNHH